MFTLTAWQWGHLELPDLSLGVLTLGHPSCFPSPSHLLLLFYSFIRSFICFSIDKRLLSVYDVPGTGNVQINLEAASGWHLSWSGLQMHVIWLTTWCLKFDLLLTVKMWRFHMSMPILLPENLKFWQYRPTLPRVSIFYKGSCPL